MMKGVSLLDFERTGRGKDNGASRWLAKYHLLVDRLGFLSKFWVMLIRSSIPKVYLVHGDLDACPVNRLGSNLFNSTHIHCPCPLSTYFILCSTVFQLTTSQTALKYSTFLF